MNRHLLGLVRDGKFFTLTREGLGVAVDLTTAAPQEAIAPGARRLDLRGAEGRVVLVCGSDHGGWVYESELREVTGAALTRELLDLLGIPAEPVGSCRDWVAIHDFEPPAPARLRVTGKCTVPTPDHRVELRVHSPQGVNPAVLILEKILREPNTPLETSPTEVNVEFVHETDAAIETVTILPEKATVVVERAF